MLLRGPLSALWVFRFHWAVVSSSDAAVYLPEGTPSRLLTHPSVAQPLCVADPVREAGT